MLLIFWQCYDIKTKQTIITGPSKAGGQETIIVLDSEVCILQTVEQQNEKSRDNMR